MEFSKHIKVLEISPILYEPAHASVAQEQKRRHGELTSVDS